MEVAIEMDVNQNVLIVGSGRIGSAVNILLGQHYTVAVHDPIALPSGTQTLDEAIQLSNPGAIVCCTPAAMNFKTAQACAQHNIAYFDLTEDIFVRDGIEQMLLTNKVTVPFIPQCGLAPGMVNILACDLIKKTTDVHSVKIRVGAIPQVPNNKLGYDVTWSADGLINEYIHQCEVLDNHVISKRESCEELECEIIDGMQFVAGLTSGGIGSMLKYLQTIGIKEANYKTLRWPGHWELIQFLKSDLQLAVHKDEFIKIFDQSLTNNQPDMIVIKIVVQGKERLEYEKIIFPANSFTAIRSSTASGISAVVDSYLKGLIPLSGMVTHDQISMDMLSQSNFVNVY